MASISSLGSGSGLDLSGILTSLMQAEQQPLLVLQQKEASYQSKISALGTLQGALSALQTAAGSMVPATGTTVAEKYSTYSASISDTTIASASASTGAVSYTHLDVYKRQLQRVRELAVQSVNSTNSVSDRAALQQEVGALTAELDRIASTTAFNGQKLLDGSNSSTYQVGEMCIRDRGHLGPGLKALEAAIEIDPSFEMAYRNLYITLYKGSHYEEAGHIAKRAIKHITSDFRWKIRTDLILCLWQSQALDEAREVAEELIRELERADNPTFQETYFQALTNYGCLLYTSRCV